MMRAIFSYSSSQIVVFSTLRQTIEESNIRSHFGLPNIPLRKVTMRIPSFRKKVLALPFKIECVTQNHPPLDEHQQIRAQAFESAVPIERNDQSPLTVAFSRLVLLATLIHNS